jgi:uncharacterized membrane protein
MSETTKGDRMHKVEADIEVDVPVSVAYGQWTQFEQFPRFMEGIEQVEQLDDTHLHWVATIAGQRKEWDAEIVEQEPDRIVSWKSTSGALNNGAVVFEPLEPEQCRIKLAITYAPETFVESAGSALGVVKARIQGDLRRFKEFIETREVPTGSWRGEVHDGRKGRTHGRGRHGETPADALQGREKLE